MTITLTVKLYSPRWGHTDTYTFELTKNVMTIGMNSSNAKCMWVEDLDPVWEGVPLCDILQNDSIYPPAIFQDLLEYLWKSWRDGDIDEAEANTELQEIITWLNKITQEKPKTDFWSKYF
jgi:hypothetical protein